MTTIYDRLNLNTGDALTQAAVTPFSAGANNQMKMVPPLLKNWQANDIANATTTNYFQNPVAAVATLVYNTASTLRDTLLIGNNVTSTVSPAITTLIGNWSANSNTAVTNANNFLFITNRQSNVVDQNGDNANVHYTPAISYGKTLSYIVNQNSGIANNSVMMGMFTSLTLANTLYPLANTFANQTTIFVNSITFNLAGNTSNISLVNATSLNDSLSQLIYLLYKYPTQDNNYFNNAQQVIQDFNKVHQFSNMGGSENYLINNFIGTPSLKTKINSS